MEGEDCYLCCTQLGVHVEPISRLLQMRDKIPDSELVANVHLYAVENDIPLSREKIETHLQYHCLCKKIFQADYNRNRDRIIEIMCFRIRGLKAKQKRLEKELITNDGILNQEALFEMRNILKELEALYRMELPRATTLQDK